MSPAVDIVIAAHNEAAQLGTCLEALHRQSYPAELIRLFVVDDRLTDATPRIAAAGGCTVLSSTSRGPAAARNIGIRAGAAPLVGFLDAHAIPAPGWVAALVRAFEDRRVGGCQARLISRATNPRIDRFVRHSRMYSDDGIIEQTVAGTRTLYPWMLTGNCMYRRSALEAAGLFNEQLAACEDVDLGWRVVLAGYVLTATGETEAVHVEGRSWRRFVTKGWTYGRGAAQIARAYASHGAAASLSPRWNVGRQLEDILGGLFYRAGYRAEQRRHRSGAAAAEVPPAWPRADAFEWTPTLRLAIAPTAVYWFRGDDVSVIVEILSRRRLVLERVANVIWRLLTTAATSDAIVTALVEMYGVARQTAAPDVDDMIDELIESGVLVRTQTSLGP